MPYLHDTHVLLTVLLADTMPKYYDEEDVKPKRACDGLRTDLKTCLVESDCVRLVSRTRREHSFTFIK